MRSGRSLGRVALAGMAVALGLAVLTAVLGPSAAVVPLPPGPFPVGADLHASPWLVSALLAACVVTSLGATLTAWAALRAGWAPSPHHLLGAAMLAVAILVAVPPVAGADVLSYAAYGHIAASRRDVYTVPPDSLAADPIAQAVEDPWRSTPSVYGPLATAEQRVVLQVAGVRLRLAVGLLDLVNGLAFALAGWLLFLLAGPDDARRRWSILTFALNPILLLAVVAEGHIDALVVLTVVGALALLRRWPIAAGIVGGLGGLVKLTAGLPMAGWAWFVAWGDRRAGLTQGGPAGGPRVSRRAGGWSRLAQLVIGAGGVVAGGYAVVGLHGLDQARRASAFVSVGTPWRPIRSALQAVAGHPTASLLVTIGATALTVGLAARLGRSLPLPRTAADTPGGAPGAGTADGTVARAADGTVARAADGTVARARSGLVAAQVARAARAGLVVALAWTLASPYVLAWYDAVPWALLALLPFSRYHRILLAHTGILALAYLPGRVVPLPHLLSGATTALRSGATPAVLAALVVAALAPNRRPSDQLLR